MANFTTTADLKALTLEYAGEPTDGSSSFDALALTFINLLYFDILSGGNEYDLELSQPWTWAKAQRPGTLVLRPAFETGTVNLTNDSALGTFSDAPGTDQTGRFLKIQDRPEFFIITANAGGGTAFTLDDVYTGLTGASLSFKSIQLDYPLTPGIMRIISPFRNYKTNILGEFSIPVITKNSFDRDYPKFFLEENIPFAATQTFENDGTVTVRFNRFVSSTTRLEFDFIPLPVELTVSPDITPVIPREFRVSLAYGAAHQVLLLKRDNTAGVFENLVKAKLKALITSNQKEQKQTNYSTHGKIIPRRDKLARRNIRLFIAGDGDL